MEIQVQHLPQHQRFEAKVNGSPAYLAYSFQGNSVHFDHTYVPQEHRGKGVAAALVRKGLEEARRQNWKIVPSCSYVAAFIQRHPEFGNLVS